MISHPLSLFHFKMLFLVPYPVPNDEVIPHILFFSSYPYRTWHILRPDILFEMHGTSTHINSLTFHPLSGTSTALFGGFGLLYELRGPGEILCKIMER